MYNKLGAGWSFVLLSGLCIAASPLSFLVILRAKRWREWRAHQAHHTRLGAWLYRDDYEAAMQEHREAQAAAAHASRGPSGAGTPTTGAEKNAV